MLMLICNNVSGHNYFSKYQTGISLRSSLMWNIIMIFYLVHEYYLSILIHTLEINKNLQGFQNVLRIVCL